MSDKILYTGGPNPFKGLIGMPEEPVQGPDEYNLPFAKKVKKWKEQVESIKSNAPTIVNPELLPQWDLIGKGRLILPGDIFDLPSGYEFKKEYQVSFDGKVNWHPCSQADVAVYECRGEECRIVLRIVKTEVKEEFNLLKTLKDIESTYSGKHKKTLTEFIEYAEKMEKQGYYFDNGDWIKKSEKVDKKLTFCDKCGEMIVNGEVHECIVSQPEPEESQKELWEEVLKYCEEHYINDIRVREHMEKHFLIQRKK